MNEKGPTAKRFGVNDHKNESLLAYTVNPPLPFNVQKVPILCKHMELSK